MGKTRKIYNNNKGGKVIASGGYGCVFNPALKCEGSTKREKDKISKLMTERHATQEYEEINSVKEKLDSIPNYEDFFLIYDATLCRPAKLTATDLADFNDKCSALPKDDITKSNINTKLDQVMTLNMPNGGLPVDDFIYSNGSFQTIYAVHTKLIKLLKHGIIPMNKHNIYHCDIKDSNVLVDESENDIKTRLIDWGLSVEYNQSDDASFPKNWRNRPLQFNVPFSVIIFSDSFYEKYSKYLKDGGEINKESLKPFVVDYLNFWMRERGAGHYKFINEILFKLYSNDFSSVSEKNKPVYVETQITMPFIINYIVDVLVHFTKFKQNGDLNLREYLNEVFIKIVDIYGFINVYYPLIELLHNNYFSLNADKLKLFKKLKFIYNKYLYTPRHEPYKIEQLLKDFKELGNLIHIIIKGKKATTKSSSPLASGITKRKRRNLSKSTLFKRKPPIKRFQNPFFLSLK
jgi:serine/threonine protein kinase